MKTCTKCKIEKNQNDFNKNSRTYDGLRPNCRACESAYYLANKSRILRTQSSYRQENKDAVAKRKSEWSKKRGPRNIDRDKAKDASRNWRISNPDKNAAIRRNGKANKKSAEGKHTASDVRAIFEKQQGLCANCTTKLLKSGAKKYHVDHMLPLALGGSNWPSNLQCLCPACNLRKSAKDPINWANENGRLL